DVNWDVTYLLNRRYDVARADEDFPIVIQPPIDGTLYHVPAMQLFPEAMLPNDTFFIHLMFQPRKEALDHGVYLLAIRDPDGTLRLGLQIVHMTTYQVILQYNPVELDQSEKKVEFSIPWTEDYWHLGVQIEKNQASFYFYMATIFFGFLKSFNFQSSENAVNQMCTKADPSDGSGYGNIAIDFDPTFGNVLVTSPTPEKTSGEEEKEESEDTDHMETEIEIQTQGEHRYHIIDAKTKQKGQKQLYDAIDKKYIKNIEVLETGLIKLPNGEVVAPASKEGGRFMIFQADERNEKQIVFDRVTGEQLANAQIDRHGVLHLPDGSKAVQTSTTLDRYLVVVDPQDGVTSVFDRRTGEELEGAVLETNGLIRLPSGDLVAPASVQGWPYFVLTDEAGDVVALYNTSTGERISGASVSRNGLITFEDGRLGIRPSESEDRYVVVTDPTTGELIVLDRRTGEAIHGAVLEENGLVRFVNGTYVAPEATHGSSPYLVVTDPESSQPLVYSRHSGELQERATVDARGRIRLPDGQLIVMPTDKGPRYILEIHPDDNQTVVLDTRVGTRVDGATITEHGLIQLPDGKLVAPGSETGDRYFVVQPDTPGQPTLVFDRLTGEQLADVQIDRHGVLHLPDGSKAVQTSTTLDRYLVVVDPQDGVTSVFDRRTGEELEGAVLETNGLIRLPSGDLVAPASVQGWPYFVL
ncbi:hypothetical protein P879_08347, partial [Paragonimus westermani]